MHKTDFGLIGLGVMGKSIALNIADNGFSLSVYNRVAKGEEHIVNGFLDENDDYKNLYGFTHLKDFIESIERPRKILLMIKAGTAIDAVITELIPLLNENDIIIDGGNSYYKDTIQRSQKLASKKMFFLGCGISGGESGARKGPSIMPSGNPKAYKKVVPILEKIAAKDKNNKPCCTYIGPAGSGHFIKMVHNGIEYAEMQLLAEVYSLLSRFYTNDDIAKTFSKWNQGSEASYLLEITSTILLKKEGDKYLIDYILDKAKNKGTGSWSSQAALELGSPSTMISSAVFARYVSSFKEQRMTLSKSMPISQATKALDLTDLEKAYRVARIINQAQGFQLIQDASKQYNWNLNLSEVARIWTNGCIIRSKLMEDAVSLFKRSKGFLQDKQTIDMLLSLEENISEILKYGVSNRIALDTFSSAFNYWIAMTTANSSANLIQAQRDYFGAHTYQRTDANDSRFFHTNWTIND